MSIADDLWDKGYLPHAWTEDERNKVQALRDRIEELEAEKADLLEEKEAACLDRTIYRHGWKKAIAEIEWLLNAFRHVHVSQDDTDACSRCGLDLRNVVHKRMDDG